MHRFFGFTSFAICTLLLSAVGLNADTIYTDRASFTANTGGTSTIDFATLADPITFFTSYTPGFGPTVGGVGFSSSAILPDSVQPQLLFALTPNTIYNSQSEGLLASESQYNTAMPMDLQVSIPGGVTAVGFEYLTNNTGLTIALSDGTTQTLSSTSGFIGFTSTTPITSVSLTSSAETLIAIGNFTSGDAAPLPSAAWGGIALLGCMAAVGGVRHCSSRHV